MELFRTCCVTLGLLFLAVDCLGAEWHHRRHPGEMEDFFDGQNYRWNDDGYNYNYGDDDDDYNYNFNDNYHDYGGHHFPDDNDYREEDNQQGDEGSEDRSNQQQQQPPSSMNLSDPRVILYLMDRPGESLLAPKGKDEEVRMIVPRDHWPTRYQNVSDEDLQSRIGASSTATPIVFPDMNVPNMSYAFQLSRDEQFSTFIPYHRQMASQVIAAFMSMPNIENFTTLAALVRDTMNPDLWTLAMQVALLNRNDTRNVDVPPLTAMRPDKFMSSTALSQARQDASLVPASDRIPITIPQEYTASDVDLEHRVAYFREDMGINLHHWTWHLVYPFAGPPQIVNKDRRGELFYYQHQQIISRYDFERLCNKLPRVIPFNNYREPMKEPYFPKMDSLVGSRCWASRMENAMLKDINRPGEQLEFTVNNLETWRDRMMQAIHEGRVMRSNYSYVSLNNLQGIDILGNMMESTSLNINENLYGNLHNLGHVAISLVHDPDQRYLETFGVMGDLATAMRDPFFYRWHKHVDDIFQQHKATLQPYTERELGNNGINITGVEVRTQGSPNNEFSTFWQQSDVDLSRGLDIAPQGSVFARLTHLQHAPFTYRIQVQNSGQRKNGTVRIFMSPKFDERGLPMIFRVQRHLFIELDKFTVDLRRGSNTIERRSSQSSLTIPFERTFRSLDQTQVTPSDQEFNFCGCGWPNHMLIPKGAPEGFPAELFVMISNYDDDRVDQPPPTTCSAAHSFCGWRERRYPDRRPMGFPFDRNPPPTVQTMRQLLRSNMFMKDVIIRFSDSTVVRGAPNATRAG